jgi:hypothetical protein
MTTSEEFEIAARCLQETVLEFENVVSKLGLLAQTFRRLSRQQTGPSDFDYRTGMPPAKQQ